MDPTTPDSRPRLRATDPRTPANMNDPKWRTTCRTCGGSFKSRNQLMRHLYNTHPGKPAKPKPAPRERPSLTPSKSEPAPMVTSPTPTAHRSEQWQVHPFILFSGQQKLIFTAHILFAIFAVWKRQVEEEEGRQHEQDQQQSQRHSPDCSPGPSQEILPSPLKGTASVTPDSEANPTPQPGADDATPDQNHQEQAEDDPELEESDDEDGGVALFDPTLGRLPFRLVDQGRGLDAVDGDTTDLG